MYKQKVLAALWCAVVVSANLTADWFVSVLGVQFAVGTLLFAATFTLRDVFHDAGRRIVYVAIGGAAVASAVASLLLGVPARIVAASVVVIVVAESADTEVFAVLRQRSWLARALSSNAVSIPLDTVLFTLLAFGGVLTQADMLRLMVGDTAVKVSLAGLLVWVFRR